MPILNISICFFYGLACFFRFFEKIFNTPMVWHGIFSLGVGFLIHFYSLAEIITHGVSADLFRLHLVASLAGLVLAGCCLFLEIKSRENIFTLFMLPVCIALIIIAGVKERFLTGPLYKGGIFFAHVFSAVSGECFFLFSGISAILYLFVTRKLKKKNHLSSIRFLPPLTRLDALIGNFAGIGFLFFTFGLFFGAAWSVESFGAIRFFEMKRILSIMVWTLFGILLAGRKFGGWSGNRIAFIATAGFLSSLTLILAEGAKVHWNP